MLQITHADEAGRIWEVASGVYGLNHPVVILPVMSIRQSSPVEILEIIEILIPKAELAEALQSAEWVNYNQVNIAKGRLTPKEIDADNLLLKLNKFKEEPEIENAIELIHIAQALEREREAKKARKPHVIKIRREVARNYNSLFMQLGRGSGFHCQHCNASTNLQIDHIKPVSKQGGNDLSNLQLLCAPCNLLKSDKEEANVS